MPKSRPTPPAEDRISGRIVRWFPEKKFGFIEDAHAIQYFFHQSGLRGYDTTHQTMISEMVTFRPVDSAKGPRAEDVEML